MLIPKQTSHSRRRFFGAFPALISTVAWLFGPTDANAAKNRIKGVLNEIETDTLIQSKPKRTEGFSCRENEGIPVLVNEKMSQPVYRLNKTGRFIWELCDGTRDPHTISQILSGFYTVDPHQVYVDCLCFLATLRLKGAIDV